MTKKKKSLTQFYNDEIYAKTKKYQKIYGFEIGTGEHDAGTMKLMLSNIHLCRQI